MEHWFTTAVRNELRRRRWTQAQLANAIGVNPVSVSRWLSNDHCPSLDHAQLIAAAFGWDLRQGVPEYQTPLPIQTQAQTTIATLRGVLTAIHQLTAEALEDMPATAHRAAIAADPSTPYGKPTG
jgi:transcriptional regulator with XRE-family HTH domain